jgi:hypothetical protein
MYNMPFRLPSMSNRPPEPSSATLDLYNNGSRLMNPGFATFTGTASINNGPEGDHERVTSWGLKLGHDLVMVMETYCRLNALGFSNLLDHTLESSFKLGLQDASVNSILFTSRPLTAGSTKSWLQVAFFGVSIYYLIAVGVSLDAYVRKTAVWKHSHYRHFRYTNIETKNGARAFSPGVLEFGLINAHACPSCGGSLIPDVDDVPITTNFTRGPQIYVSYERERVLSGWFLRFDPHNVDSSYYEVHASSYDEDASEIPEKYWTLVGTPIWHVSSPIVMDLGVGVHMFTNKRDELGGSTGIKICDPRPRWHWLLYRVFRPTFHAISFFSYALLGMLRRPVSARVTILTDNVMCMAVFLICGVGYVRTGQIHHAAEMLMYIPFFLCTFYGIVFERTLMSACLVAAVVDVLVVSITTFSVHGRALFTMQSLALATVFVWVRVRRWQTMYESRRLVKLDQVLARSCLFCF